MRLRIDHGHLALVLDIVEDAPGLRIGPAGNSGLPSSGIVATTLPVTASNTVAERLRPLNM